MFNVTGHVPSHVKCIIFELPANIDYYFLQKDHVFQNPWENLYVGVFIEIHISFRIPCVFVPLDFNYHADMYTLSIHYNLLIKSLSMIPVGNSCLFVWWYCSYTFSCRMFFFRMFSKQWLFFPLERPCLPISLRKLMC